MNVIHELFQRVNVVVWGVPMLVLILGTGFLLQVLLRAMPIVRLGHGFKLMWQGRRKGGGDGEISPFQALMTALAATIGTGNIAGVATAIFLGGPGALFWMWCTALLGMATKYSEVMLAVEYREQDKNGQHVGGPMYVIKNALGKRWVWLGWAFAGFGGIAAFGAGNGVQANSIAEVMASVFGAPHWVTGLVLAATIGAVILGGIQRIGAVASALVPLMAFVYVACSLVILALRADALPEAFRLVLTHAFTPSAASGGVVGATVATAMRFGVARGVFSNEAGLGTAGIAQAAGTTRSAVRSGLIGMLGTFIDTIIVCTMTGLVIISTGVWKSGKTGAALTSAAFERALPGVGGYLLALSLVLFAYTTMLGWAYYGERCWEFMLGERATRPFRVLWTIVAGVGAVMGLDLVWLIADTLNAMMAIPNLVSLVVLSPVVVRLTREYFATQAVPAVQGAIE